VVRSLRIIHLPQTGDIHISIEQDGEHKSTPQVAFTGFLDPQLSTEMEWYFGQYLDDPFGPSKERAQTMEQGLRNLGRLLFEATFGSSDEARSSYATACEAGLTNYQLEVISDDSAFLGLPWELLNEPEIGYLASRLSSLIRLAGIRAAGTDGLAAFSQPLPTDQLNLLMVSPRADGESARASLAIETLKALDALNIQVQVDFLRPASLSALSERLTESPNHYHLVHFDAITSSSPGEIDLDDGGGTFVSVSAAQVGEALTQGGVPLALLNAADNHSNHSQASNDIAIGLASSRVPVSVTVPFPLTGPARELFLQNFYQALVKGQDAGMAVASARSALMDNPHRPSPAGKQIFWDWIGPTVWQSYAYTPPIITEEQPPSLSAPETQTPEPEPQVAPIPQGGPNGLIGRNAELRQLEDLFQQSHMVLLWGDTGVGKTELTLGLARWLVNTGSRSGGVLYSSMEVGAGLERVIHEAGTGVGGLEFADLTSQQQRRWLLEYFQQHPSLLILDALENAAGFPLENSGLLDETELSELDSFLSEVAEGGQSWVLLVSRRNSESWLTGPYQSFELTSLAHRDALALGNELLEKSGLFGSESPGANPERPAEQLSENRLGQDYLALLELLQGHPLALQIAVPLLKDVPASVVVNEITNRISGQGTGTDATGTDSTSTDSNETQTETETPTPLIQEESRPSFLTALMDYSFSRMSRRSRNHLPFLSLFRQRVLLDIFTHITEERAYRTVMGEELGWGASRTLLRSARDAGFLDTVNPSVFQINSSFPWFFGSRLYRQLPPSGVTILEREFVRVYADTADYFMETLYENQESGVTAVLAEEGNLTQALGLALESKEWDSAQLLVQPLAQVYRMQKRYPELRRLRRQLLESVVPSSGGASEAVELGSIELWLYLLGTEASESSEFGDLDHADDLNNQVLEYMTSTDEGASDPRTAATYRQLGEVALKRWRLADAEGYASKSLEIIEDGEDRESVADNYYLLGLANHRQQRYAEAKDWFSKALDIHQRSQDPEEMVKVYRALGLTSQFQMEHDEAESWYRRAQSIVEENRDEETAILIFHELGTVSHARYQFEEAESLYRQALTLSYRLGKDAQMAVEFHHLGLLAQSRGFFYDDAEDFYIQAMEKYEALGDARSAGDECRQLGVLFHEQKRLDEAERWYQQANAHFQTSGDTQRIARTYGQLGMIAEEREDINGALEWVGQTYRLATEHNLPVLAQVESHLARLESKFGEDSFNEWWRGFMGNDPPSNLEIEGNE